MNYENYTNVNIQTYKNKSILKGILRTIAFRLTNITKRKKYPNKGFLKVNMSRGFNKELNKMWVAK